MTEPEAPRLNEAMARDYEAVCAEGLAIHLKDAGLRASASGPETRTGIGPVRVRFRVDDIMNAQGVAALIYWARIDGLRNMAVSPVVLDLAGFGDNGHSAMLHAVHVFADAIVPVLRRQVDGAYQDSSLQVTPVTSVTDNRKAVSWELITGPAIFSTQPIEAIQEAVDNLALMQGIMDSITPALERRAGHWFKVVLGRGEDHVIVGNVKVDSVEIPIAPAFAEADYGQADAFMLRQFGMVVPVSDRGAGRPGLLRRLVGR